MSGGKSSEQTVGYKYYAGVLFKLGFGPFDKITKLTYADRIAWQGEEVGDSAGFGQISVSKPNLLGGESREGGVSGTLDVGMGYPTQPANDYLQARMGAGDGSALVPAYRDVVTLIARQFYWGNNPYLKPLAIQCQRIHKTHEGATQWYDSKAEIFLQAADSSGVYEDFADGIAPYSVTSGSISYFSIVTTEEGDTLRVHNPAGVSGSVNVISRNDFNDIEPSIIGARFNVEDKGYDDPLRISFLDSVGSTAISFIPFRAGNLDPSRRPVISSSEISFGSGQYFDLTLNEGVWYDLVISFDWDAGQVDARIYQEGNIVSTLPDLTSASPFIVSGISIGVDDGFSQASTAYVSDIYFRSQFATGDINPAHFIREIHTNPVWGGAFPDSEIGATYATVADTLYDEGLGVSFYFSEELSYGEMVDEVLRTIDAVTYLNRTTLQHEIKLIRPDYDPNTLTIFDESNSKLADFAQTPDNELFNQVVLKYLDEEANNWVSLTFQDVAAIELAGGHIISKTIEYAGISNADVATMVGQRDLQRYSRPYLRGSNLKINRKAFNLNPGDPFKLQSAKQGLDIVGRVVKLHPHKWLSPWIEIDWVEDIYSSPYNVYTPPTITQWVDPNGITAADLSVQTAFEVPYFLHVKRLGDTGIQYLPADSCFYGLAGGRPTSGLHLNYSLFTYTDGLPPVTDEEEAYISQFTPYATVSQDVSDPEEAIIPITPVNDPDTVKVGHLVLIGNGVDRQREIGAIAATVSEGDTTLAIDRGVADTIPRPITAGTVIYIIGDHYGLSDEEYLSSEIIEGYGIAKTGSDQFAGPYTYHDIDMADRQALPYPPANFKVDGYVLPLGYNPSADTVTLTWRYRDRVLQSDQIIDWFEDADYGPEVGTTFRVESDAYDADGALITANWLSANIGLTNTYNLDTSTAPANTAVLHVRVWSVRDGLDSLQAAEVSLLINGELLLTAGGEPLITTNEYLITGS